MELSNPFPGLNNIHNFIFTGQFNKHNYYRDIDLFKDLSINNIKSNTKWDCKLQTNFPGNDIGLLNFDFSDKLYKDILSYLKRELKKHHIKGLSYQTGPWYNIYKKGFSQERHSHLNSKSTLSACYYYRSPSTIQFFNPETRNTHIMDNNGNLTPYEKSQIMVEFEPEEGAMILFSSELDHLVPIYDGDDIRISFSFNLNIQEVLK